MYLNGQFLMLEYQLSEKNCFTKFFTTSLTLISLAYNTYEIPRYDRNVLIMFSEIIFLAYLHSLLKLFSDSNMDKQYLQ